MIEWLISRSEKNFYHIFIFQLKHIHVLNSIVKIFKYNYVISKYL